MYAFPTLLSIFYSFCIALHSQLYFVFRREPKDADKGIYAMLKWYLILPIVASGVICKLFTMDRLTYVLINYQVLPLSPLDYTVTAQPGAIVGMPRRRMIQTFHLTASIAR